MKIFAKLLTLSIFTIFVFTLSIQDSFAAISVDAKGVSESAMVDQAEFLGDIEKGIFEIELEIFAIGGDVYIPDSVGGVFVASSTSGFELGVTHNGVPYVATSSTASFVSEETSPQEINNRHKIVSGSSAVFTVRAELTTFGPTAGQYYGIELRKIRYGTSATSSLSEYIVPNTSEFETSKIVIDGIQTPINYPPILYYIQSKGEKNILNPGETASVVGINLKDSNYYVFFESITNPGKGGAKIKTAESYSKEFVVPKLLDGDYRIYISLQEFPQTNEKSNSINVKIINPVILPSASILIGNQTSYVAKVGSTLPAVSWNSVNGDSYKTTITFNDLKKCKRSKDIVIWSQGKTANGTFNLPKASKKIEGCVETYTYEVSNSKTNKKATSSFFVKYISEKEAKENTTIVSTNSFLGSDVDTKESETVKIKIPESQVSYGYVGETTTKVIVTDSENTQSVADTSPSASILIGGKKDYTVRTGETIPTISWTSENGKEYKTKIKINSKDLCKGLTDGDSFKPAQTASGSSDLGVAEAKKEGCVVNYEYKVTSKSGEQATAIATLRYLSAVTSIITPTIKEGDFGVKVSFVQYALQKAGYFTEEITGYFGNITKNAVSAFQQAHALDNIGAVGPKTSQLLNQLLK